MLEGLQPKLPSDIIKTVGDFPGATLAVMCMSKNAAGFSSVVPDFIAQMTIKGEVAKLMKNVVAYS